MDEKVVLVTGIGGNVGQGILRNIKATGFPIHIVGTNSTPFSPGNHLCDSFFKVPMAYEPTYTFAINSIVKEKGVDLIIPATDFEVDVLSRNKENIDCEIVVSHQNTTTHFLDKFLTYEFLHTNEIPFAPSVLPSKYAKEFPQIILKPRKGRGSRGIYMNPNNYDSFNDEEYLIQELIEGTEITTAFYVTKQQQLHSFITFERLLDNGATSNCRVVDTYDTTLEKIIKKLIAVSQFYGAINLQSMVTQDGTIVPFEINCRISGTNSIRSNFGFQDVRYTLEEWLYKKIPSPSVIKKGVATRILMDVIYEDISDYDQASNTTSNHYIF